MHSSHKNKISTEMYLKTIFILNKEGKEAKPKDLVNILNLSKGSVSEMIKKLIEEDLIEYESFKNIKLTKKGSVEAKNVYRKYLVIEQFLRDVLKLDEKEIADEACRLEHAFSDKSIARLNILNRIKEN